MPDEPNTTPQQTPPQDPPQPNDPAARNEDGSLKDSRSLTPEPETKKDEPKVDPPKDEKKEESKADDKKPEEKKDEKPLTGAPEKYEAFKAPEGYELNEEVVGKATELFKKANLSQEGAQSFIDFHAAELVKAAEAPFEQYVETRKNWRNEMAMDKEIGNGKDDLKPEVKQGLSAVIAALPPAIQTPFKEAMVLTGAGDNPAFVKAFYHLSKPYVEGKLVTGKGPSPAGQGNAAAKTGAQTLYPNLPSEHSPRAG